MDLGTDMCAQTLYESPHLVVTAGASAEYLLAMKLAAGRDKDISDIEHLLHHLNITRADQALEIYQAVMPGAERRSRVRALLARAGGDPAVVDGTHRRLETGSCVARSLGSRRVPALRRRKDARRVHACGAEHCGRAKTGVGAGADAARTVAHGVWTSRVVRRGDKRHPGIHSGEAGKGRGCHHMAKWGPLSDGRGFGIPPWHRLSEFPTPFRSSGRLAFPRD